MTIKGYVVRGTDLTGGDGANVWAMEAAFSSEGRKFVTTDERQYATEWPALAGAFEALVALHRWYPDEIGDVRIFAVAEDGTETEVPSYAEALAENERLRAENAEQRAALRKLFTAARALIDATTYVPSRTLARTPTAKILALAVVSEDVRHLVEDEQGASS